MSSIPDFSTLGRSASSPADANGVAPWETPEGIAVPPVLDADAIADLDFPTTFPGLAPYVRGPYPTMYVLSLIHI